MATTAYTTIQRSHADALIARARFWTRGTSKQTGEAFVIFPSSRQRRDGPQEAWYATAYGCTCPSFTYRGSCAHELAVRTVSERQQAYDTYKKITGACAQKGCLEDRIEGIDWCARHQLVDAF